MKTDQQLQADVLAELKWEPAIDAAHIGVEVNNGVVTLAGHVTTFLEKWEAERAALRVNGVKALTVEIQVNLPGMHRRDDIEIATSAENVLRWSTDIPHDNIQIMVENGWVTLTGEVKWEYQRRSAAAALRHLIGLRGITNRISLKPESRMSIVKSDIDAALNRIFKGDKSKISVDVQGADVTLTGMVQSWQERELIENSIWSIPGVSHVVDKISVAA